MPAAVSQSLSAVTGHVSASRPRRRESDLYPFSFGVRLGSLDQQLRAAFRPGEVRDVEADQFGAPQRAGEPDQEVCATRVRWITSSRAARVRKGRDQSPNRVCGRLQRAEGQGKIKLRPRCVRLGGGRPVLVGAEGQRRKSAQ
jgi:hypothetical protein